MFDVDQCKKSLFNLHEWTNQEGDIMIDNTSILALTDIIQLPEAERLQAIKE